MLLSLCLLLPMLSPSSQEICSAPGALPAPILYLSRTSTHLGDSMQLKCSVFSQAPATHIIFCKDGKIISSQTGSEEKVIYKYAHAVSTGSSGKYSCGYEIKDSDNRVHRSQLSPAQRLSNATALLTPILYLSQTSAQPGDTVRLQCSVFNQAPATRIIFYKGGEEVSSQTGSPKKVNYDYDHVVSSDSSGSYACGYEIKDSDTHMTRSQLSPAQHLIVTGALTAPILYVSETSAQPGDSVRLQCSVFSLAPATCITFYKDGEEVSSQRALREKITYDYDHMVSSNSAGNYTCGYEIKDSNSRVNRSQLSPAKHLSVTGVLSAPILHMSQMSARPGDSVRLQCSVFNQAPATRIIFYKGREELLAQTGSPKKVTYDYDHVVSSGSSGNYSCGYEIQDSNNRVSRSQLSPAQHLSVTGPAMSPAIWAARCSLVLLLLVSAPVITFVLEKQDLTQPVGQEEILGGSISIFGGRH